MLSKNYLIIVSGPTAVGKSALANRIAQHFQTDIISADSRQFYREMNIGTAKVSPVEQAQVQHHFIDDLSIHESYSVGDFERDTLKLLKERFKTQQLILLCGGSGLFIRAICQGLDHFPDVPADIRKEVGKLYQERGIEALQKKLKKLDPVYFKKVDLQNPHRLMRALSVCKASGKAFSSFQKASKRKRQFKPVYILLTRDRKSLYKRINDRVDWMFTQGLLDEARQLLPFRHLNALQTVGYQELFSYFDGKITLEEAKALIKRNTRRYAKRQGTWFRKNGFWKHFSPDDFEGVRNYISEVLKNDLSIRLLKASKLKKVKRIYKSIDQNESILGAFYGKKLIGALKLKQENKYQILGGIWLKKNKSEAKIETMLLHEFIMRWGGADTYCLASQKDIDLLKKHGFSFFSAEEAPLILQEQLENWPGSKLMHRKATSI